MVIVKGIPNSHDPSALEYVVNTNLLLTLDLKPRSSRKMTGCCREKQEGKLILEKDVGSRLVVKVDVVRDSGHILLRTQATEAVVL